MSLLKYSRLNRTTMKKSDRYTQANSKFKQAQEYARHILQNPEKLKKLLTEAAHKLQILKGNSPAAAALKEKVGSAQRMAQAYIRGDYRQLPWKSILLIVSGIIYFVMPLDLIPDFIPLSGFLDDLSILLWIFQTVKTDIEDFEAWEQGLAKSDKN